MTSTKIYPGMITDELELFVVEDELKAMHSGKVFPFSELPFPLFQLLKEQIELDDNVKHELIQMHPVSEYRRIEQFAKCRFGGLDHTGDISLSSEKIQDGEYWECPKRGNCQAEGVVCKLPQINNQRLTIIDVQIMQLSSSDKTNEVIAEEMNLPMGTYNKIKFQLYHKLKAQTKQCVTKIAFGLNII